MKVTVSALCRVLSVLFVGLILCSTHADDGEDAANEPFSAFRNFYRERAGDERVIEGTKASSEIYYDTVARALSFPGNRFPDSLDDMLELFGCSMTAGAIEGNIDVDLDGIVTTRYFSPKTTDVSGREDPQRLSWRQVVRISAQEGSVAKGLGLRELWWLTNVYHADANLPFAKESQNNQVILVPATPVQLAFPQRRNGALTSHRILFAVYGAKSDGYALAHSTTTSWDAGTVNADQPNNPSVPYFAPLSCIQCHGEVYPAGRLNMLDTDYYLWRSADANDFPGLQGVKWATPENGFTLDPFMLLNQSILKQNVEADSGMSSFQSNALEKWIEAHGESLDEVSPPLRAWDGANEQLVSLLVKYCYRCHGTIGYSVLDRQQVLTKWRSGEIEGRLGIDMPQDRILYGEGARVEVTEDLKRLSQLLKEEFTER